MSKKKIIATVYCLLLLLVSCSKKTNNDVDNQTSKPTDPVCLTIEADKSLYEKEEAILLTVGFAIMEEDSDKTLNISVASGEFLVEGESSLEYDLSDNNYVGTLDSEGFYEPAEFVTFALSGMDSTITSGEIRVSLYTYDANGDQQYFMSKALYYASDKSNIVINMNSEEDAIDDLPNNRKCLSFEDLN